MEFLIILVGFDFVESWGIILFPAGITNHIHAGTVNRRFDEKASVADRTMIFDILFHFSSFRGWVLQIEYEVQ